MSDSPHHNDEGHVLHTEPSFCIYSTDDGEGAENLKILGEKLERCATIGESVEAEFSFGGEAMRIIEEDGDEDDGDDEERASDRLKNLNIVQGEGMSPLAKGAAGDAAEPAKLRNYAQYLESTGDLSGAEEYYFQATQNDPKDGETLSQYAKVVWQLRGNKAKASHYFEKAVEAAPQDSNILAAYASFLWDIDEEDEAEHSSDTLVDENPVIEDSFAADFREEKRPSSPPLHLAMGLGIKDVGFGNFNDAIDYMTRYPDGSANTEEYYKRMVEENPHNPLFLRNYALFLQQSKGDLEGAEEYYSRGILEDPHDGQMLALYAGIVWQLHRDKDRAVTYFKRALEVTPNDSNVLAAYAKFLWETEAEEDVIEEAQSSSH